MSALAHAVPARTRSVALAIVEARVRDTDLVSCGPGNRIRVVLRGCTLMAAQHVVRRLHAAAAAAASTEGIAAIECFVCPGPLAATDDSNVSFLPLLRAVF